MERRVKERLVGASLLAVMVIVIAPELLSGPRHPTTASGLASGVVEPVRNVTVDLATSKATPVDEAVPMASGGALAPPPVAPSTPPPPAPISSTQPSTLENPPHSPASTERAGSSDAVHSQWAVQIGSFASRANADSLVRRIRQREESAYVSSTGSGSQARYRVRVGPFADRNRAEKEMLKLKHMGEAPSLISP